jgi:hypothetical protein
MRFRHSERERGQRPRSTEIVDERTWGGLVILIRNRIEDGSFGEGYPSRRLDGRGPDHHFSPFASRLRGWLPHRTNGGFRASPSTDWTTPVGADLSGSSRAAGSRGSQISVTSASVSASSTSTPR